MQFHAQAFSSRTNLNKCKEKEPGERKKNELENISACNISKYFYENNEFSFFSTILAICETPAGDLKSRHTRAY